VGTVLYAAASIGFLLLAILLLLGWEGRSQGARLITACGCTAAWAAVRALDAGAGPLPAAALVTAEALRFAAWIVLLDGLARAVGCARSRLALAYVVALAAICAACVAIVLRQGNALAEIEAHALIPAGMVAAALALAQLGLIGRSPRADRRDALRWLVAALGFMFGLDGVLFTIAWLRGGVDPTWILRGGIGLLAVPMIAIAARRNPHWSPGFFVSRHVVYYGSVLAGVALYATLSLLAGRWIAAVAGAWSQVLSLVFFAAAALVLVVLLGNSGLRQPLRVFVNKHFYRSKYDYRREWLRFIQTLSAAQLQADPRRNAIRAIAQIIASPGGVLFLRDERHRDFAPVCAWPGEHIDLERLPGVAADDPMVTFLERRQWVIDVRELRETPALYGDIELPVLFDPPAAHRIVLPLLHGAGLIGFIVLDEPPSAFDPNYEDRDLLKTVGRHVATHIEQHETDHRLTESRQFEAYHRLTAFVMHDLKNLAAQLALIVANAERHKRNPEFVDDTIQTVANSTRRMQRLIEQLQAREIEASRRAVSLADAVARAVERCRLRAPVPAVDAGAADLRVEADPEQLIAGLEHVIRNAQDATPRDGSVRVELRAAGAEALVTVTDTGCGMTPEFVRQRLFKPFDTTKGSQGMGIGAYQLREYVHSLEGAVEVASTPGAGTVFTIRLRRLAS
jgi:putative PEP-CTERM system histidine kinase